MLESKGSEEIGLFFEKEFPPKGIAGNEYMISDLGTKSVSYSLRSTISKLSVVEQDVFFSPVESAEPSSEEG